MRFLALVLVGALSSWLVPTPGLAAADPHLDVVCPSREGSRRDPTVTVLGEAAPGATVEVVNLDLAQVVAQAVLEPSGAFRVDAPLEPYQVNRLEVRAHRDGRRAAAVLPEIRQGPRIAPGVVVLKLVSASKLDEVLQRHGHDPTEARRVFGGSDPELSRTFYVRVPEGTEYRAVLAYREDPDVLSANLDFVVTIGTGTTGGTTTGGEAPLDVEAVSPEALRCTGVSADLYDDVNTVLLERFSRNDTAGDNGSPRIASRHAVADVVLAAHSGVNHPLLLVDGGCDPPLPPAVDARLEQLYSRYNSTITPRIFGGEAAVPACVAAALDERYRTPQRAAGPDRCATSADLAASSESYDPARVIILARGDDLADAAAAAAATRGGGTWALLLTGEDLCPEAVSWLSGRSTRLTRLIVAGGPTAVAERTVRQAVAAAGFDGTVERYGGPTRVETSIELATALMPDTRYFVHLVPGHDALSAAVAHRRYTFRDEPVVYFSDGLDPALLDYLAGARQQGATIGLFGRTDDVSARFEIDLRRALRMRSPD